MSKQHKVLIEPLAPGNYLEPEVLLREQERIFSRTWQYACHIEKLRQPGDFVVCDVAGQSLILICESPETINAFHNVCAHRAARLLQGEGCKKRFSCPYHAWTYNTRGELVSAPNAENVSGFDVSHYRLRSAQVEVLHGLVFVNLDPTEGSLAAQVPGLCRDLKAYAPDLPALTFVHRTETRLHANWKVGIENFAECYHCELIHKALVKGVLDFKTYQIEVIGKAQKHFSRAQSGDSRAFEFDEKSQDEFISWWMWPNFAFQSYPGGRVHVWQWTPIDVEHTQLTVDWYFPNSEMEDWERTMIEHHARTTFAEDLDIIESVQQGLASRGYEPGPLMIDNEKSRFSEHAVAAVQQWWREAMETGY